MRDDAGGHYKGEGWCMRTLLKGGMVRKEGIIKKGGMMQEDVVNGRDDAGQY